MSRRHCSECDAPIGDDRRIKTCSPECKRQRERKLQAGRSRAYHDAHYKPREKSN